MMHDYKAYLYDIQNACEQILQFTKGITASQYSSNDLIKSAVERKFVLIGEALNRLKNEYPNVAESISDYHKIIGFRNVLVHGYDIIDDDTVWSAIKENTPILLKEAKRLLGN